ncbi:hypothetical protein CCYN49044_60074 [Capnocytophaga cynodegmi]|uniref:Uncharacterized protein n=1 Tax=Capnocytophaga cynodegmi TaxID=28189 RepID=A0A0B7HRK9_9FLAO|nr:hypothetical protein CCYN74_10065 [Capnocytophaga cynodegmi]CEN41935.1 hypothetical protein CCYN49044_60074 [Capnocytophaga cynodegmi]
MFVPFAKYRLQTRKRKKYHNALMQTSTEFVSQVKQSTQQTAFAKVFQKSTGIVLKKLTQKK